MLREIRSPRPSWSRRACAELTSDVGPSTSRHRGGGRGGLGREGRVSLGSPASQAPGDFLEEGALRGARADRMRGRWRGGQETVPEEANGVESMGVLTQGGAA